MRLNFSRGIRRNSSNLIELISFILFFTELFLLELLYFHSYFKYQFVEIKIKFLSTVGNFIYTRGVE